MVTFLHFTWKTGQDENLPLIQFSKFSVGSIFSITHPRFDFNVYNIYAWTLGDISALYPRKCQEKSTKIGSHIYAYPW